VFYFICTPWKKGVVDCPISATKLPPALKIQWSLAGNIVRHFRVCNRMRAILLHICLAVAGDRDDEWK
jgi:hypothetical protein